jgi:hypothetical protein
LGHNLTGLTVSLNNFQHSWAPDIGIVLQSPTGQKGHANGNGGWFCERSD